MSELGERHSDLISLDINDCVVPESFSLGAGTVFSIVPEGSDKEEKAVNVIFIAYEDGDKVYNFLIPVDSAHGRSLLDGSFTRAINEAVDASCPMD